MKGLYDKYNVTKTNGEAIDPNAVYFVLRLDTDVCARRAAELYAWCVEDKQPELAAGLETLLRSLARI